MKAELTDARHAIISVQLDKSTPDVLAVMQVIV
jgi:hypothetical protein